MNDDDASSKEATNELDRTTSCSTPGLDRTACSLSSRAEEDGERKDER